VRLLAVAAFADRLSDECDACALAAGAVRAARREPMPRLPVGANADGVLRPVHLSVSQVEEVGGAHAPPGDSATRHDEGGDAAARRLHATEPEAQEVLAGVAGFPREVGGLDPVALQEGFEACGAPDRWVGEIWKGLLLDDLRFKDRFCGLERLRRPHDECGARRRSGQKKEAATRKAVLFVVHAAKVATRENCPRVVDARAVRPAIHKVERDLPIAVRPSTKGHTG
jgi:hypothetical protein